MVLLLAALAGCSENPKPIEPTTSATTIPVPTIPAQASEDSVEGRAAFAAHWVDLVNYAAITGDTGPMLSVTETCTECEDLAVGTAAVRVEGRRITTPLWVLDRIQPYGPDVQYVRILLADNPKLGVSARTFGIWVTNDPPYAIRDLWREEE